MTNPTHPPTHPLSASEAAKKAIRGLGVRDYAKYVSTLPQKQQEGAFGVMWKAFIEQGVESDLDELEIMAPQVYPPNPLLLAIVSNNVSTTKWLLERENFLPGGKIRHAKQELLDEEHFMLLSTLDNVIRNTNHDRAPVFNAVSLAYQKYPQGISDNANFYKLGLCISSAYVHGDLDCTAVLIRAAGIHLRNSLTTNAQNWASLVLSDFSYEAIVDLMKNKEVHSEFGRAWDNLLPIRMDDTGYEAQTSWEVILLNGGRSTLGLCTKPDSPMLPQTLDVLDDDKNFKMFLEKQSKRPSDLARILNSNDKIAQRFLGFQTTQGESSLHVLLKRMPHYTFSPKWGKLTSWLDKNAAGMFSKPFADGRAVDEFLVENAPMWYSKRRRSSLMAISKGSSIKRTKSGPGRVM